MYAYRTECGGYLLYLSYLYKGNPTNDYLECVKSDEPIVRKDLFNDDPPGYAVVIYNF
jgi:hypothetical protein